jgi:N-acetyl sugar amidotransferase
MKTNLCKSFSYDFIVSLSSDVNCYTLLTSLKNEKILDRNQILSVTFNHRFFNIHEKNLVKGLIDEFDLDHLMFSLKPSASMLLMNTKEIDLEKFLYFSQVIFTLQCMQRYGVNTAIISKKYFDIIEDECEISIISSVIKNYIIELLQILKNNYPKKNINKLFASISSFLKLSEINQNSKIIFDTNYTKTHTSFVSFDLKKQISEIEKDIFWIGFDSNFIEVPWDKKYPNTKWTILTDSLNFGDPTYNLKLKYCSRCCMPETMEGITFDEFNICTPCRSSEEKMHINWEEREQKLQSLLQNSIKDEYYDCMLPMSGGKDSMFQAYILTQKYNITPLAVTHGANWMSLSGRYNLENCLQKFDLDHIIFHSKRSTINKAARKSLNAIGDACWHCHIGSGTFTIQTALHWNVDLMIWGESIAERDGRGSYINQTEASLFYNLEVSAKVKAESFVDEKMNDSELSKWFYPDSDVLNKSNIRYLHLGDYIFWDEERQVDFVVNNFEWCNSKVENTYKGYKSTECIMSGVHDYSNFIKRGIGRATIHASDDVRRGLMTREEAFQLIKKYDTQRPHALDYYLRITGFSEEEFEKILIEARSLSKDASKLNNQ